jgi:L-lysine 2,3-aminomutase
MFKGTQANPYDDIVGMSIDTECALFCRLCSSILQRTGKATDETLTSENWELILNLCDKVQDEGEQG